MSALPQHVAIIMDGNGRWAEAQNLPRVEGHRRGMEISEEIITSCAGRGVRYLTLYAFSEENWSRPEEEVGALCQLLKWYVVHKRRKMIDHRIRFRTIGTLSRFPEDVVAEIEQTIEATRSQAGMTLILALSYGGRQEICRAFTRLIEQGEKDITQEKVGQALDTAGIPDPDLLIRTSGEFRTSNFLPWQMAYTELYFTETLWPDFDDKALGLALKAYEMRERRFGLTSDQLRERCA